MGRNVSRETGPVRVAVIGTGTAVGKTHATRALATAAVRTGSRVAALKPIESGIGHGTSDYDLLARAANVSPLPQPYAFPDPVSPHLAARRAGAPVRLSRAVAWVERHQADWTFVESAGALLSPLSARLTNLDLVVALACDAVVLVAADRLGVLHDVRACRHALSARLPELPLLALLQPPARPDASTGTNARELALLRIAPAVVAFPRARSPQRADVQRAASHALRVLRRLVTAARR